MRPEIEKDGLGEQRRRELVERLECAGVEMWRNAEGAWMVQAKKRGPSQAKTKRLRTF